MPAAARSKSSGRHVFISHSSEDAAVADKVCRALESDGLATWICSRDIQPGQTWAGAISDGLERSGALVLLFTANANRSDHVLREVDLAVKQKVPILPVRLDDTPLNRVFLHNGGGGLRCYGVIFHTQEVSRVNGVWFRVLTGPKTDP